MLQLWPLLFPQDMAVAFDSQQIVIWAYGHSWGYHGPQNRGYFMLTLNPNTTATDGSAAAATTDASGVPADAQVLTFTMPNIAIPSNSTTYM